MTVFAVAVLPMVVRPMVHPGVDRGIAMGRMRTGIMGCAGAWLRCGGVGAGAARIAAGIPRLIGRGRRCCSVGSAILIGHLFCLFLRARGKGKAETEGVKGGDPLAGKEPQKTRSRAQT
ncbi:hypothetical protein [Haematobacter genomosp. 1]|uniref:hypothetical protein n=1 Tax=Haematobacter genomosp. 1 TaxID=366618 RepID=UPI00211AEE78|nr:hypothetical protein [Haematobacter genomosp. 1]